MALTDSYVSKERVSSYGHVFDSIDDVEFQLAGKAGTSLVNKFCNRNFNLANEDEAVARMFWCTDGCRVLLDDIATDTDLVLETNEVSGGSFTTTWDAANFQLEPLNGVVDGETGWPYTSCRPLSTAFPRGRVRVTATWGWPAVPAAVVQATLIVATRIFMRREAPEGVAGGWDTAPTRFMAADPEVAGLLGPYRRLALVA